MQAGRLVGRMRGSLIDRPLSRQAGTLEYSQPVSQSDRHIDKPGSQEGFEEASKRVLCFARVKS